MEIIRKTNVLIKTQKRLIVRHPEGVEEVWCDKCAERMVTARQAAVLNGTGDRAIFRLIENGGIHFVEMGPETYVCFTPDLVVPPEE